jgi:hypothetical protein
MKAVSIFRTLIVLFIIASFLWYNQTIIESYINTGLEALPFGAKLDQRFCIDDKTGTKLSYQEALEIARQSDCIKEANTAATFAKKYQCDQDVGTWRVSLNIRPKRQGCSPVCEVSLVNQTARINWRCTGFTIFY